MSDRSLRTYGAALLLVVPLTVAGCTGDGPATAASRPAVAPPETADSRAMSPDGDPDYAQDVHLDGDRLTFGRVTVFSGPAVDHLCDQQPHPACVGDVAVEDQHVRGSGRLDAGTTITLVEQGQDALRSVPGTRAQLAAALTAPQWGPYWHVTVSGDRIVDLRQVYTP